jgi:hypothetical protein
MAKSSMLFAVLGIGITAVTCVAPASAITVELAKKCRALELKAHPYKLVGERGAGSAQVERAYFKECIDRGGDMSTGSTGHSDNPNPD